MRLGPIPVLAALALVSAGAAAVEWVAQPVTTPPGVPIALSFANVTVVTATPCGSAACWGASASG